MASIRKMRDSNKYSLEICRNGNRNWCTLKVCNRDVAEAVLVKVNKLEEAARVGCDAEDVGLQDWVDKIKKLFPALYATLEKSGLVRGKYSELDGILSCEESLCETDKDADPKCRAVCESGNIVEVNSEVFFGCVQGRDAVVFSRAKQSDLVYVFLTKQTASQHGIGPGWKSGIELRRLDMLGKDRTVPAVNIFGTKHTRIWDEYHGMVRFWKNAPRRFDLERRWEIYEAEFADGDTIIPGNMLARSLRVAPVRRTK